MDKDDEKSIKSIGDIIVKLDSKKLRERLKKVLSNPHGLIIFPNYRDYDRNIKYDMPALARWTGSTPTKKRIYTKRDRAFILARHCTFHDIKECHPGTQKAKIAATYALARKDRTIAPYFVHSYYLQCGKSSFWSCAHLKDTITNKYFIHSVTMHVMINAETRRPQPVIKDIKNLCKQNWNNDYPKEMKSKYQSLKLKLSKDMTILNKLNKNNIYKTKKPIFSYPIQLRYLDEDQNHHINTNQYVAFAVETLNNYDIDIRKNKKVIYSMSNLYWKEMRMIKFEFCYVNIWEIQNKLINNDQLMIQVFIGTVDIDNRICKRKTTTTTRDEIWNNDKPEWTHYHGFIACVVNSKGLPNKL